MHEAFIKYSTTSFQNPCNQLQLKNPNTSLHQEWCPHQGNNLSTILLQTQLKPEHTIQHRYSEDVLKNLDSNHSMHSKFERPFVWDNLHYQECVYSRKNIAVAMLP